MSINVTISIDFLRRKILVNNSGSCSNHWQKKKHCGIIKHSKNIARVTNGRDEQHEIYNFR